MTANLKHLFSIMMNDFTHLIIHTIISKNRIDADPAILVKQFYMHFIPNKPNKNTNKNTNISPFTKHFFDQFIQKIKHNLPITYSHTNNTNQLQRGFKGAQPLAEPLPLTIDRGFKGAQPLTLKGRPSKPKIITIDTTNIDNYDNHEHEHDHVVSPNRYSKHYAHLSTSHELIEEPFDHEFDDYSHHTNTRTTRSKRTFNYNGIPLLIDNSNLLYKPQNSLTPFALFNYSLHKIIPLPPSF
jgi:hypothetical protein